MVWRKGEAHQLSSTLQVAHEPVTCQLLNLFEGARFFEQVRRPRNDLQFNMCRLHLGFGFLIEVVRLQSGW